jgi:hypothetical protein
MSREAHVRFYERRGCNSPGDSPDSVGVVTRRVTVGGGSRVAFALHPARTARERLRGSVAHCG